MHGSSAELTRSNKHLIFAVALLQGVLLYVLQAVPAVEHWSPMWRYLCYSLVIALPPILIVSIAPQLARGFYWVLAGFGVLLALLASYRGYQCTPADVINCEKPFTFALCIGIASFILAFLLRAAATDHNHLRKPDYQKLFHYSWDNALTIALTLIFVGIFWLILILWGALFKLVGVGVFRELFEQEWFAYPVSWFVAGAGVVLFRSQQGFVLTLKRLLRTMLVALLPLLAVLVVIFLATLPFTGLQPIWDTGRGSALLLWLVALLLFFTNGVIQDEFPFARYPKLLNRLLLLALVLAPIYGGIALYGLYLRVDQYGWSPERLWGFTAAITLAFLALSYCVAIVLRGEHWAEQLRKLNTGLAFWVLAVCLITQSPLADFWKISASNQLARLQQGKIEPAKFDFHFLRKQLGKPGLQGLQQLAQLPAIQGNAELADYVEKLQQPGKQFWKLRENPAGKALRNAHILQLQVFPTGAELPADILNNQHWVDYRCTGAANGNARPKYESENEPAQLPACFWLLADMNGDGSDEALLFSHWQPEYLTIVLLANRGADDNGENTNDAIGSDAVPSWREISRKRIPLNIPFSELRERIANGNYQTTTPRWRALTSDNLRLFDPSE